MEQDYLAGLFDGAGTIFSRVIGGRYNYITLRIILEADEEWLGGMLIENFGGKLDEKHVPGKLTWTLSKKQEVLNALLKLEELVLRKLPAVKAAIKVVSGNQEGVGELKKFNQVD